MLDKYLIPNLSEMVLEYCWCNKIEVLYDDDVVADHETVKAITDWINFYSGSSYPPYIKIPRDYEGEKPYKNYVISYIVTLSKKEIRWWDNVFTIKCHLPRLNEATRNMCMHSSPDAENKYSNLSDVCYILFILLFGA